MSYARGIEFCGGRRFCLTAVCCLLYTALLVFGQVGQETYMTLQLATVGAYIAGNGAQKWAEKKYAQS